MPGPRVYTLEEVQELVPKLTRTFAGVDALREKLRTLHLRINALELIWGRAVHEDGNPDHGEFAGHLAEMKSVEEEIEKLTQTVQRLSGQVKSVEPPLVDFYGVRDGHLVYWCWTRGEERIEHWHHIDAGFAGRQPV
jgi:hypothetical protein